MADIDFTTDFGKRVLGRLAGEQVVWLTTVSAKGTPQPSPVWFLWQDGSLLVFSQPDTPKVRNIARGGRVSLNFNSTPGGSDVVVLTGDARIVDDEPPGHENAAYIDKYREGIASLGMDPEAFAREYSAAIRVTPTSFRGF